VAFEWRDETGRVYRGGRGVGPLSHLIDQMAKASRHGHRTNWLRAPRVTSLTASGMRSRSLVKPSRSSKARMYGQRASARSQAKDARRLRRLGGP
jgi:hypothetical protein